VLLNTIEKSLRPLKFAFLVQPRSRDVLKHVIKLNSILWGGTFNPIIPAFKYTPKIWKEKWPKGKKNFHRIINGYLDAFDPDYIVIAGECNTANLVTDNRYVINIADIEDELIEHGKPGYGISIFDILDHLYDKEFKFVRQEPLEFIIPSCNPKCELFISSMFGMTDNQINKGLRDYLDKYFFASSKECQLTDYTDLLYSEDYYLQAITKQMLDWNTIGRRKYSACVYYMDPYNYYDIIDFWNLRAMGWKILPIAKQSAQTNKYIELASRFVNHYLDIFRKYGHHDTKLDIMKSRGTPKQDFELFADALNIKEKKRGERPFVIRNYKYPRIYNEWARTRDGVGFCNLYSKTEKQEFSEDSIFVPIKSTDPEFKITPNKKYNPLFANLISMRFFGTKEPYAQIIPKSKPEIIYSLGLGYSNNCRMSNQGPLRLISEPNNLDHLQIPKAEDIFIRWLWQHGWECKLSSSGQLIKQMLLQLNGIYGTELIANEVLIRAIGVINGQRRNLENNENDDNGKNDRLLKEQVKIGFFKNSIVEKKGINDQKFLGLMSKAANSEPIHKDREYFIKQRLKVNMFKLGLNIKCQQCGRSSWYSLEDVNYKMKCKSCENTIDIFTYDTKELEWAYQTSGTFHNTNYSDGAFPILLTLRLFSMIFNYHITPLLSFDGEKKNKKIEVDLGLFLRKSFDDLGEANLLFAECKTFNYFKRKDVERIAEIGLEFPGAILAFITLNNKLTEREKKLIISLENKERKKQRLLKPHNFILILTGNELFSNIGSINLPRDLIEACDYTLIEYLGIKTRTEYLIEYYERKKVR